MQGDLLAEAQFVLSQGLTLYSLLAGAITITVVLQIVQWVVTRMLHFNSQYYSLSYLPSLLLLAMLTNITHNDLYNFTFGYWTWILPLILLVYVILVFAFRGRSSLTRSIYDLLWRNYVLLFAMMLICGAIPRTNEVCHYELSVERHIMQQDYQGALSVGRGSLHTTRRLGELRMYALSKQGLLPECLFDYPQEYGADGLLQVTDQDSTYRYTPLNICHSFGVVPKLTPATTTQKYLLYVNSVDTLRTPTTQDYLLCYLLLQKDLKLFEYYLKQFYPQSPSTQLPRAYREAVVYINNVYGGNLQYSIPADCSNRFAQYRQHKIEIAEPVARANLIRRDFGNTFWWYYENK